MKNKHLIPAIAYTYLCGLALFLIGIFTDETSTFSGKMMFAGSIIGAHAVVFFAAQSLERY